MISISQAEYIHSILILKFGGTEGISDKNALISALARPFQSFEDQNLYPSSIHKAAALIESLLSNHPLLMVINALAMS